MKNLDSIKTKILHVLSGFALLYAAVWVSRVIMGVSPNLFMRWLGATPNFRAYVGSTFNYGVGIAVYIIFPALALQKWLRIDPRPIFFPVQKGWWKDLVYGFVWVTAVLSTLFLIEVASGWLVVDGWNWQMMPAESWMRIAWVGLLVNIGVAIGEETIFRGYLLTGLKAAAGKWPALAVMTIIFGLFHLPAYGEAGMRAGTLTLAIILASLFGLLFGIIYLRTGALWLPVSLHFTWNFIENDVFNLTAESTNVNLIGALTRLQSPLTMTRLGLGNVVVVEGLVLGIIALGAWAWVRHKYPISESQTGQEFTHQEK